MAFRWVRRDDEELVRYEAGRRPGRAAIPKHADLKNRVEKEREEFRTGFLIPDVYDLDNIVNLQLWDGTVGSLAQVNFIHVSKEDTAEEVVEDKMEI